MISDMNKMNDHQALPNEIEAVEDPEEAVLEDVNDTPGQFIEKVDKGVAEASVTNKEEDKDDDKETNEQRPTRTRDVPERLEPTWGGKSYAQAVKEGSSSTSKRTRSVRFMGEEVSHKNEVCQNLIHQEVNPENQIECDQETGLYIARTMNEIRSQSILKDYSYAQQYSLRKELKKLGEAVKMQQQVNSINYIEELPMGPLVLKI